MVETTLMREKTFNMRLAREEWERLERLAKGRELNAAGLIRALLREEDERLKPRTPTPFEIEVKARQRWERDCKSAGARYDEPGNVTVKGALVTLSNATGTLARYTYTVDDGGRIRFTAVDTK
jgi:hypothetical protein